jgi:DNA gyrase subunit A
MTIFEKAMGRGVGSVLVEDEMRSSYLDYAMSVIVSRALPDVRDGLKPVHRRILYAMDEGGYVATKPYRKSARVVGDVMGKYHPHGDGPIYESMVRMKQEFSMSLPLIDGQGNFGSMDGDSPAAMRYTEARLAKVAMTMLEDIDKDTVDFRPSYDESGVEPVVLPVMFPNFLVNGGSGIAVGMATSVVPHNLGEVCDACLAYLSTPDMTAEDLLSYIPGPDFPTGAQIIGRELSRRALLSGRGPIRVRGTCEIEEVGRKQAIVCTAIPYQVNKSRLMERIAEVVNDKTVEGVSDLRDESSREGVRIVVELKREAIPDLVLKQLYHHTPLQTTLSVNMLALEGSIPRHFNVKEAIEAFVKFRDEVIYRRTVFLLDKARERGHVVIGLMVALSNLDEVIVMIRSSKDRGEASDRLTGRSWVSGEILPYLKLLDEEGGTQVSEDYVLSSAQAHAILELRLHRLTGLERDKLEEEAKVLAKEIEDYLDILGSEERRWGVIRDEVTWIRDEYSVPRRTEFIEDDSDTDAMDLVPKTDMVVVVTHGGYVKRVPLSTYRAQRRGGKGRAGMATKEDDGVSKMFVATTHSKVLFFSSLGRVYLLQVYRLPPGTPQSKGKALVNQLPLRQEEAITAVLPLPEDEDLLDELHVMFATSYGYVRRNRLSDFKRVLSNGKTAMKLEEGEKLVAVKPCREDQDVFLSTRHGMAIRFSVLDVRVFQSRASRGVRGVRLDKTNTDAAVGMEILDHHEYTPERRRRYLRAMLALRRSQSRDEGGEIEESDQKLIEDLEKDAYKEMQEREQLILSVSDDGMGRLCSAYDYRITGRGGKGLNNVKMEKGREVVASFVVETCDQVMLIADDGQIIRMPCNRIRQVGRPSVGVRLFDLGSGTKVASVVRLGEENLGDDEEELESGEVMEVEPSLLGEEGS